MMCAAVAASLLTFVPGQAEACSCGGPPPSSAEAVRAAELVFVGRILQAGRYAWTTTENPDGSFTASSGLFVPPTVESIRTYKGDVDGPMDLNAGGSSCDFPFKTGETWLIYATGTAGRLTAGKCGRTRLLDAADSDLRYLEGRAARQPQGIVHGYVHRRLADADGALVGLGVAPAPIRVVAASDAGVRFSIASDNDSYMTSRGTYQLVLPPGEYEVWVEYWGRLVSPVTRVRVDADSQQLLHPVADYDPVQ